MELALSDPVRNFRCVEGDEVVDKVCVTGGWPRKKSVLCLADRLRRSLRCSCRLPLWLMLVHTSIRVSELRECVEGRETFRVDFSHTYSTPVCEKHDQYWQKAKLNQSAIMNLTGELLKGEGERTLSVGKVAPSLDIAGPCARDSSLLYLLLTLGTVWFGTFLYKFKQTPYLTSAKRELLTDYALPVSVIIMSFIGSILFNQINRRDCRTANADSNRRSF